MMNAPTIAEKRPVLKLVIEMNTGISRLRFTNTTILLASSFQASVIRLSSYLTSSKYILHISDSLSKSSWAAVGTGASVGTGATVGNSVAVGTCQWTAFGTWAAIPSSNPGSNQHNDANTMPQPTTIIVCLLASWPALWIVSRRSILASWL